MSSINEEMLLAWCDNELDEVNRRRVDRAMTRDPELEARIAAHRQLRDALVSHFAPIVDEGVPERFTALMKEGAEPVTTTASEQPKSTRWAGWAISSGVAISLLLGMAIGRLSSRSGEDGVAVRGGQMVARGAIAKALDSQLSSTQGGRAVQVRMSFQRRGGGWCRTFNSAAMEGVACRDGARWRVEQVVPGSLGSGGSQKPVSADTRIVATVRSLIAGSPADTAQEARARDSRWR